MVVLSIEQFGRFWFASTIVPTTLFLQGICVSCEFIFPDVETVRAQAAPLRDGEESAHDSDDNEMAEEQRSEEGFASLEESFDRVTSD
jgi:hypothetical protein